MELANDLETKENATIRYDTVEVENRLNSFSFGPDKPGRNRPGILQVHIFGSVRHAIYVDKNNTIRVSEKNPIDRYSKITKKSTL